jgi:hypothetical protein
MAYRRFFSQGSSVVSPLRLERPEPWVSSAIALRGVVCNGGGSIMGPSLFICSFSIRLIEDRDVAIS